MCKLIEANMGKHYFDQRCLSSSSFVRGGYGVGFRTDKYLSMVSRRLTRSIFRGLHYT